MTHDMDMENWDDAGTRRVLGAYQRLPAVAPSERTDRAILDAARTAATQGMAGPARWMVWPVSIAAALAVTVVLFYQIASLVPEAPTVVVLSPSAAPAPRPEERIGATTESPARVATVPAMLDDALLPENSEAGTETLPTPGVRNRGQDLVAALEAAARANDVDEFRRLLETRRPGAAMPDVAQATRDWALQNNVDLSQR